MLRKLIAVFCFVFAFGACCTILAPEPQAASTPVSYRAVSTMVADDDGGARGRIVSLTFDQPVTEESADALISVLDQLPADTLAVVLTIDSTGGDVKAARRITRRLDELPGLACVADGNALSAAYYILQACPLRLMTPRSSLLIHEAVIEIDGDPKEARKELAMLDSWNVGLAHQMCDRLSIPFDDCVAKFSGVDWWVNVDEAKEIGAVDAVVSSPREVADRLADVRD